MATLTEIAPVSLNNDEILRYSRHLIMPEVGMEGQLKLKASKVLCIGAGGLGSPLALYLGAAGVGTLAWWTSMSLTIPIFSVRSSIVPPMSATRSWILQP